MAHNPPQRTMSDSPQRRHPRPSGPWGSRGGEPRVTEMAQQFCTECGASVAHAKFCPACGQAAASAVPAQRAAMGRAARASILTADQTADTRVIDLTVPPEPTISLHE